MINLPTSSLLSVTGLNPLETVQKGRIQTRREIGDELVANPMASQLKQVDAKATCESGDRSRAKTSPATGKQTTTMPTRDIFGAGNS
jgi:hypothetical protein